MLDQDPYLNVDCGTMSPYEHGEVFVLDDGGECDLDLGNYERYLGVRLTRENNITTGKIYARVIQQEREGRFLGKTVQIIPHVTDAIQEWIERVSRIPVDGTGKEPEVCVVELGGTIGDIESSPFVEALRQLQQFRVGPSDFCSLHVSLLPVVGQGEIKTKPTQTSVRELRAIGFNPDLIMCRCALPVTEDVKKKISLFTHVPPSSVIGVTDVKNTHHVPLVLYDSGVAKVICTKLGLNSSTAAAAPAAAAAAPSASTEVDPMAFWRALVKHQDEVEESGKVVTIAIVGKYTGMADTYLSVIKALQHASLAVDRKLKIEWVNATFLEPSSAEKEESKGAWQTLEAADGVLVPGGFGDRGIEGMVAAIRFVRERRIPYLGLCLGMQLAVIEFARNVLAWTGVNSAEFDPMAPVPVIIHMPDLGDEHRLGGTLRLGLKQSSFKVPIESSIAGALYGKVDIAERHRHRYEVNPSYVPLLESKGLRFVAHDVSKTRMEILELGADLHPFFVGTQAHPEFLSRPGYPSPLFLGLLRASVNNQESKGQKQ